MRFSGPDFPGESSFHIAGLPNWDCFVAQRSKTKKKSCAFYCVFHEMQQSLALDRHYKGQPCCDRRSERQAQNV